MWNKTQQCVGAHYSEASHDNTLVQELVNCLYREPDTKQLRLWVICLLLQLFNSAIVVQKQP